MLFYIGLHYSIASRIPPGQCSTFQGSIPQGRAKGQKEIPRMAPEWPQAPPPPLGLSTKWPCRGMFGAPSVIKNSDRSFHNELRIASLNAFCALQRLLFDGSCVKGSWSPKSDFKPNTKWPFGGMFEAPSISLKSDRNWHVIFQRRRKICPR